MKRLAKEAKTPLSKFIIEIVESTLSEDIDYRPRGELVKGISGLRQENKRLRNELRLKNVVIERYEEELKRYRSAAFLEKGFEGVRKYHRSLLNCLKEGNL
jgi:hypothetical protein